MHRILERQMKRYLNDHTAILPEWRAFFESVSRTYADFDEDRALLNRSFEISSREFSENNRHLSEAKEEIEKEIKERTENLEKYETLINNLSVGVYRNTPGPQGNFLEANPAVVSMFECSSKEEFLKHHVSDFYQDPAQRILFVEKIMKSGFVKNEELNLITLKGRKITASVSVVVKKDKNGNIYFDGVVEDITDRKKMEEALKEAREKLELKVKERTKDLNGRIVELEYARNSIERLLEDFKKEQKVLAEINARDEAILANIGDGLVVTDLDERVIFINLSGEQMLGWKTGEILGKDWFHVVRPKGAEGQEISLDAFLLQKDLISPIDCCFIKKDGSIFPVSLNTSKVSVGGKPLGSVIIFRDVTKEREIDQAKREFVSLASHQLRTPLTGIEWTIERFSKKETLTIEGKKYLQDIHFSASRLSMMVKLLLNVSRIESGSVGVVTESLDVIEFVNEYMREHRGLCEKGKIFCVFAKHPEKLVIATDKNLFGYFIQNLISNAIAYTPAGGRVEIFLEEKKGSVLFTVRDTGIGIPPKEQARIFEKFFRASNAIKAKPDGTGLGLYIVRESVRLLGGKIWFESPVSGEKKPTNREESEKNGCAFFIELPLIWQAHIGGKGLVSETE